VRAVTSLPARPLVAHPVNSRQRSASVASGVKRILTEPRLLCGIFLRGFKATHRVTNRASRITVTAMRGRPVGKLHTMEEVAEILGLSKRSVQRLVATGALSDISGCDTDLAA
jgi:hypothetical protein